MPRLTHIYEKAIRKGKTIQQQELHITANTDDDGKFDVYNEVEANLFIDGKLIADISHLLDKANKFIEIVDSINWEEIAADVKIDNQILN